MINVSKEFVDGLFESKVWSRSGINLSESRVHEADLEDEEMLDEEVEVGHVCPLCESELEEELDEDSIMEHVGIIASMLAETLNESAEYEDEEEEDED